MSAPILLAYAEAAVYLHLPVATLRVMVHRRTLPHIRVSPRKVLFDVADLDAWLAARKVTT